MSEAGAPLGLLGGTFDPIHFAHLRLAQEALQALELGRVRFIPAGQPVHRGEPGAAAGHRLAMTRLALDGQAQFELDEAEVMTAAPSYTVTTLQRIRHELGAGRSLVLIMGADAFAGLHGWYRWRELFELAHIAVATRPGYQFDPAVFEASLQKELVARKASAQALAQAPAGSIVNFDMTPLDISATRIRETLGTGGSARFLVPDAVLDYIETHSLYRKGTP